MKKLLQTTLMGSMAAMMVLTGACSEEAAKPRAETGESTPKETGSDNQTVTLTTAMEAYDDVEFSGSDTWDANAVYEAYEKDIGVKVKNLWVVNLSQYKDKLKVSIAANEIPDFFWVPADTNDFAQLVKADMIMDLTELWDEHASEETKKWFSHDGGKQLQSATIKNKLMAIPQSGNAIDGTQMIWIRKDWLDKLQLPEPKTMQDLLRISEAFTTQDPDGNGEADTIGLGMTKDLYNNAYGLEGFFNGYHAYPKSWVKDDSGKLAYGSIQPEMKTALKQLQDMFKAGQIDPEFGVKDPTKANEMAINGKLGITIGQWWNSSWPLKDAAIKDGKLVQDWRPYKLVSIDGNPALSQIKLGLGGYYVVSKKAKNPEAVFEILNRYIQVKNSKMDTDELRVYEYGKENVEGYWKLNPIKVHDQSAGEVAKIPDALKNNDVSMLSNPWAISQFEGVNKYKAGDVSFWDVNVNVGDNGSKYITMDYAANNQVKYDEFFGPPTKTMGEKLATLQTQELEIFTKIILDGASIDEFDKFVESWKKLGGDQMTQEVNEWHESMK